MEMSSYTLSPLRTGDLALYRATGHGVGPTFFVVAQTVSAVWLRRLEQEYALREELDAAWSARPLELHRQDGRWILVLEDPGGEPLDRVLVAPLALDVFLRLAIGIATAVRRLHERHLIHKDLKPENILVDINSFSVWLTGFGLATRLPREHQEPDPPDVITGTLAYIAPEQTGRMNRSIDSRSDLYSLGIILYEMLTGALPFSAVDPLDWVHCHIAREPLPPERRIATVPAQLSAVVMKLLAKTSENRYQTAAGVEADLRECLERWTSGGNIEPFSLGSQDVSDELRIPERLYGRERPTNVLLAAFRRLATQGSSEIVLVSGHSGIGKSFLINEFSKALLLSRGLFAFGKCDQYQRETPYAALAQAFEGLIRSFLGESEAQLDAWRRSLAHAVGQNGQLLVALVPALELILGPQSRVPDLPPREAKTRFHNVFHSVLLAFAGTEHPLVLFLDDLQWVDYSTLDLLENWYTREDPPPLMLIGAYRDNEVDSNPRLLHAVNTIRQSGANLQEIAIGPLTFEDIAKILTDTLQFAPEAVTPLAELVHEKTGGNPFFVIQFISSLAEEHLISFDPGARAWRWDLDLAQAKEFSDSIVEFMLEKLGRLPRETVGALQQLACLGDRADLDQVRLIYENPEASQGHLREAVRSGLLLSSDRGYRFLHDRVQEAAYLSLSEGDREAAHLRIGQLLAESVSAEEIESRVFDIVNQMNRGRQLLTSDAQRERLAELNLLAGRRAKASIAYEAALGYFFTGSSLLTQSIAERKPQLGFDLHLNLAECEFLTGEANRAEARLLALAERTANIANLTSLVVVQSVLYTHLGKVSRAVDLCLQCLRRLGIVLPDHPGSEQVRLGYERLCQRIDGRSIESLMDLPQMIDEESCQIIKIMTALCVPANLYSRDLMDLVVIHIAILSVDYGNTPESCFAYVNLSMIVARRFGDSRRGYQFGHLSISLVDQLGIDEYKCQVYGTFGILVLPWLRHRREGYVFVLRACEFGKKVGELTWSSYAWWSRAAIKADCGDPLDEVQRDAEAAFEFAKKAKFPLFIELNVAQLCLIRCLRGLTRTFGTFDEDTFEESAAEKYLSETASLAHAAVSYWISKLQARFFAEDYASAVIAATNAERMPELDVPSFKCANFHFYAARARAASYDSLSVADRPTQLSLVVSHHRQLSSWSESCPANFADRAALVGAEIARIEGRLLDSEGLYEFAIQSAREHGFVQNEGIAFERAAKFYAARGFKTFSDAYLQRARACFLQWGATAKVKQLDVKYPHLANLPSSPQSAGDTKEIRLRDLDLAALTEMYQAVSGELILARLIERLMVVVVKHAGAVRGILMLARDGKMPVVAEAVTNHESVKVRHEHDIDGGIALPLTILNYVIRAQEFVLIDDAQEDKTYSADVYVQDRRARSVLCLPLKKRSRLVGVLYLENNVSPHIFSQDRLAGLQILAAQAATSIENAGLFADIQEAQNEARRVGEEFRRAFDLIPALAWRASGSGAIEIANKQWHDYTGIAPEEVPGGTWMRAFHPDDLETVSRKWHHLKQLGISDEFEARMRRRDGKFRSFLIRVTPSHGEDGKLVNWFGTHTDIDDLKRAQDLLRKSEADLAEGQRISHTGSWTWSSNTDRVLWSEECARIFGFGPHERDVPYVALLERIHPEDQSFVATQHEKAMLGDGDYRMEHRIILLDGTVRTVLSQGRLVRDADNKVIEYVGTIMDITEQKDNERQMREAQAALSRVSRLTALGELTTSIAHEVNQPLMAIVTNAAACSQWLTDARLNIEEARVAVQRIIRDGRRAGEVIGGIRALAKKAPAQMSAVDLNAVILEVLALIRNELDRHNVVAETDLLPLANPVLGDRVLLQQVTLNLIMNGIEAIDATAQRLRRITVRSRQGDSGYVWVTISDTGIGLEQTGTEKIFESFYTTKPDGIGMGLSICRSIMEAHHGRLWASAGSPHGSEFHFTLPVYHGEPLPQERLEPPKSRDNNTSATRRAQ
jgi:PAS domain S-box-containing protein